MKINGCNQSKAPCIDTKPRGRYYMNLKDHVIPV